MKKFAWVVLALLVALVAVSVYFLRDEPLTSLAEQALNYQPVPVPVEQNAFVGVAGLNALAGRDFIQMGEAYIRNANLGQAVEQDEQNFDYGKKEYPYSCAKEITANCLDEIRADAKNIQKLQEEERELIQRYLRIQEMPDYSNQVLLPSIQAMGSTLAPRYDYLGYISRILSAQAILDIKNGQVSKGLNWFQKDMAFYRRVFAAKDAYLLDKMFAVVQIRRNAILLSLLIEEDSLRGQDEILRALLAPLDAPKENMMDAMWREHTAFLQAFYKTPFERGLQSQKADFSGKLAGYFLYKQNMTANLEAELWNNRMSIIDKTPAALLSSEDINGKTFERTGCTFRSPLPYCKHLKNFTGEILVLMGYGADTNYFIHIYDHDAFLHLVRAQLEYTLTIKQANSDTVAILASLPPETFNPYTGKPFDFDVERGVIGFRPAANRDKDKRVEIRISKPNKP
ncbi:MAG: hypothetical protein LBU53_04170 [Zoogloeaceae bacterium]|nr:hypothetical protein [Zoogloeaceae bacterium]